MVPDNISKIREAIVNKHPIAFRYVKPGGRMSVRIGNPYVLYKYKKKSGRTTYYVYMLDLVQTKGQSDSLKGGYPPTFRRFRVNRIRDVVHDDEHVFKPDHPDYNRYWEKYTKVLGKV